MTAKTMIITSKQPTSSNVLTCFLEASEKNKCLSSRNTRTIEMRIEQYLGSIRKELRHRPRICYQRRMTLTAERRTNGTPVQLSQSIQYSSAREQLTLHPSKHHCSNYFVLRCWPNFVAPCRRPPHPRYNCLDYAM